MSLGHLLDRQIASYAKRRYDEEKSRAKRDSEHSLKGEENILIRKLRARIARNQDARIAITGQGGVGKSSLELDLGEILNPEIYVDNIDLAVEKAISFTGLQFMDSTTLPNRTLLGFDEPGQGMYHRQFMSQASQILAQTFIGNRFQQFYTVLTIPGLSFLDIDAIRMTHYLITIEKQGQAQVYEALWQKFGGDIRWRCIIDSMPFGKPRAKLWHAYEKKKIAFQSALYAKFRKELQEGEADRLSNNEIADIVAYTPSEFGKDDNESVLDYTKIMDVFGVGVNRAYTIRTAVKRKLAEKDMKAAP